MIFSGADQSPNGDDPDSSNPPSLESVSSNGSLDKSDDLQGLERIEKLEAMIANITEINDDDEVKVTNHQSREVSTKDAETQTISTGDIGMLKVWAVSQEKLSSL